MPWAASDAESVRTPVPVSFGLRYALGMTEQLLRAAMDAGQLTERPTRSLAHVLIGALDEAAMVVATAEDRNAAREEVRGVLHELLDGLTRR